MVKDIGGAVITVSTRPPFRKKSGRQNFDRRRRRMRPDRADVAAKWAAPPSGRSSRSTEVITTWRSPSFRHGQPDIVRLGWSSGPGKPVRTLQKAQARVQVSPMIIMVACALLPALADIGAAGLLADRVQPVLPHYVAGLA
jgi:hypothetical protein